MSFPKLKTVGIDGILVQFSENLSESANRAAISFANVVRLKLRRLIEEVATTPASTFVRFDPLKLPHESVIDSIKSILEQQNWYLEQLPERRRHFIIPCVFDGDTGPQFEKAANMAGLTHDAAVKELTSSPNRVLSVGFAPGQPYMGQLEPNWDFPRLKEITPKVPKGALVVAIRQLIIFASETPTGWYHIGKTGFECFRPYNAQPFALQPGDEITLEPVSQRELQKILLSDLSGNGGAEIKSI